MRWNELRKFKRDGKAAVVATVAGLVLAAIGLSAMRGNCDRTIQGALCVWVCVAVGLVSPVIGVAGASVRSLNRASFAGAIVVGLPSALLVIFFRPAIFEGLWLWAASCSFGSILAQVGALAGGTLADRNVSPQSKQFTLRQTLAFFIPVAIFLGYVTHFPKT
jgi:hypothetical protein